MSTNLEVGIVGLPNVGKSTLFNAITKAGAEAANYPFCTIEPNVGVVDVPDARLKVLGEMFKSKKIVPAAMRFVDIAGLVKGASKGEGLGNKFLAHIREVDAVAQVVRCFEDGNITHVEGSINPLRDIEIINTELCLADMETVEKRQERLVKLLKTGDKKVPVEKAVLDKVMEGLGEAVPARRLGLTDEEKEFLTAFNHETGAVCCQCCRRRSGSAGKQPACAGRYEICRRRRRRNDCCFRQNGIGNCRTAGGRSKRIFGNGRA